MADIIIYPEFQQHLSLRVSQSLAENSKENLDCIAGRALYNYKS